MFDAHVIVETNNQMLIFAINNNEQHDHSNISSNNNLY